MPACSIWIPCNAFDVIVTADDDAPTDLEKAVMRFLAARHDHTLEDVVAFLGLSERLTMDLLIGLWRQGYIIVDTVDGGLRLDPAWEAIVQADRWNEMKSAHRVSDTVELMRELVSGQIVANRSSPAAPPPERAVPILIPSTINEAVTRTELAAAAMRSVSRNSPLASRIRKVHAEFARAGTSGTRRPLSWLRLDFEPELDSEGEQNVTLRPIATDDVVLARVAPEIARALNNWSLSNADHPVVRSLVALASKAPLKPRQSLAARLEALVRELEGAVRDPARHEDRARELTQVLAALSGEIDSVEAARGKATFFELDANSRSFLHHAMDFEHQLVLTAPDLNAEGLDACAEALVPHLKNCAVDSSAVILWGTGRSLPLSGRSASFLANMAAETSGPNGPRLRWSQRTARISTPMAVLDGRDVLYSNLPPFSLNVSPERFGYLLKIEASSRSVLPRTLLEIARERAPDVEMADLIQLRPWSSPDRSGEAKQGEDFVNLDAIDLGNQQFDADSTTILAQKTRFHDLLATAQREARRLASAGASVEAVVDAALFKTALEIVADADPVSREGTLWLGFGEDRHVGRSVPLHRRMVEGVADRAAKGLLTVVLLEEGADRWAIDVGNLLSIADAFPNHLLIIPVGGLTGHFVCGDDRFLAAPGGLASPPAPEVRRLASRLVGVSATDPDLCDAFRAAFVRRWPVLAGLKSRVDDKRSESPDTTSGSAVALAPIFQAWRQARPGGRQALATALVRAEGFDSQTTEALLDLTAGGSDEDSVALRRDVLAVIATRADEPLKQRALHELAAQAWTGGKWQQAALLLEGLKPPAPASADLASAMATVVAGIELRDLPAAFQSEHPEEWTASVALATWAVLFNGDGFLAEALEIKLSLGAPPEAEPLRQVAEAVLAYWAASGDELDMAAVRAILSREKAKSALRSRATALCDAFRLGANANYNNSMLKRVVPRFYTTTSGIKPVVDVVSTETAGPDWAWALAALNRVVGGEADPDDLADEILERTHREYADARDEPIQGRKGAAIRRAARELMRRALELRDTIRASQEGGEGSPNHALASLLRVLRSATPPLEAMAAAMPVGSAARPIMSALARRITRLADGAS